MSKLVTVRLASLAVVAVLAASPVWAQQTDPVITQTRPVARPPAPITGGSGTDDSAGTADANRAAAAAAEAQTRKIIADKEAFRAEVDRNAAEYDAKMELYRRQVAEQKAKAEAIRRANEARMALYQACVAGNKAACAQYKAQQ